MDFLSDEAKLSMKSALAAISAFYASPAVLVRPVKLVQILGPLYADG
jgi:hypothetical protein